MFSTLLNAIRRPSFVLLVVFLSLLLSACTPPTVDEMRAGYKVELNGWVPQPMQAPEASMDDAVTEEAAEAAAASTESAEGEGAEGEAAAEAEPAGPAEVPTDILFDLVVRFNGLEALPGITVDLVHVDSAQQRKNVYRHWIDTSSMLKGEPLQESFKLEGVPFVEGDAFAAEMVAVVPEADRGEYREYAGAQ